MFMVPEGGIEPPQDKSYTALNRARLPVPPFRQIKIIIMTKNTTGAIIIYILYTYFNFLIILSYFKNK